MNAHTEARQLIEDLHKIRIAALKAVDPRIVVERSLRRDGSMLYAGGTSWDLSRFRRILLIGFGKAAIPMAEATIDALGQRVTEGVIITKYGHATHHNLPEKIQVVEAGHPVPDAAGQRGAEDLVGYLAQTDEQDLVIVLISGGGSALLPLPVPEVSLSDLQKTTDLLLRSGATINELNAVRKHLSRVKGGQLARLASPATVLSLILSDVVGDPLDVIASGPTVPDSSTYADAWDVLKRHQLLHKIPASVRAHLQQGLDGTLVETPKPGAKCFKDAHSFIVGSNLQAAKAAVAEANVLGYHSLLLTTFVEGEAREVAKVASALAKSLCVHGTPLSPPACLVWGGETTVTVGGDGKGGRNQELALSAALELDGWYRLAMMALATDGTDGPTNAGGAIIDGTTVSRARSLGLDPEESLSNNDAYTLLDAVEALIMTGPTGTNVNDLLVILVDQDASKPAE